MQETQWKGNSARKLGGKVYSVEESAKRNGVGITLHPQVQESITEVVCINGRQVGLKLVRYGKIWHLSTYALQQGCREEGKEEYMEIF